MDLNWTAITIATAVVMGILGTAIGIAFAISIVTGIFGGLYLPKNVCLIGPVIGGLIAGHMVGGRYIDGLVNGGISAGIAGLIALPVLLYLLWDKINTAITSSGYQLPPGSFMTVAIVSAFTGFAMFFVLGIIGAIIGVAIKNRSSS